MKSKEYIDQMKNIKPSDDLINRTIKNIQHINNAEKNIKKSKLKAIIIGTITTLGLCVGTVGAYVAISGNTEILEAIGIHLSKNYEENSQNTNSIFKGEGFEAELLSAGIDNSNLVLELKLNLDEKYSNTLVEDLKVKNIEIERPSRPDWSSEYIEISQNQNISEMEDGNYKLFKYINVKDPNLAQAGFWDEMFAEDEKVKVIVTFDGLYGKNNKLLEKVKDNNKLEVELTRPTNLIDTKNEIAVNETIKYKNVRATVQSIQPSTFGNIILINVYEKDVDWNKVNTIQKIDFDIKDKDGNKVKIISRNENLTLGKYNRKDGDFHEIGLEIQLTVDDKSTKGYDISLIEENEIKVSSEKIKKQHEDMLNDIKINNYEPEEEEDEETQVEQSQKNYYKDYVVLYYGREIEDKYGVQYLDVMDCTQENLKKYNINYYVYKNSKYIGQKQGTFEKMYGSEDEGEGAGVVQGVERVAISKKYNAIPRQAKREKDLPEKLMEMADYPSIQIDTIDLDGDGKEEHIVCARANYSAGQIGDGSPEESSIIMLFDSEYNKIADLEILENGFWANSEQDYKEGFITEKELDKNRQYLTLDEVDYIDVNNDGKMEILINCPTYDGLELNVVGYANGKVLNN